MAERLTLNSDYCEQAEARCIAKFAEWVENHPYFESWTPNKKYAEFDVSATDIKGRKCEIELKYRPIDHTLYNSYFIEADKLADGLLAARGDRCIPLYINFFRDGKVAVWNLADPNVKPVKDKRRRKNIGTGVNDANVTYRIPLSSALLSTL